MRKGWRRKHFDGRGWKRKWKCWTGAGRGSNFFKIRHFRIFKLATTVGVKCNNNNNISNQGVEPNLNSNYKPEWTFSFWWTRTEPEPANFYFSEPNQTWTFKIVLKWTQTRPEPLTKVRIYFSISGCRWRWYTHNKSSGDYQQDQ